MHHNDLKDGHYVGEISGICEAGRNREGRGEVEYLRKLNHFCILPSLSPYFWGGKGPGVSSKLFLNKFFLALGKVGCYVDVGDLCTNK